MDFAGIRYWTYRLPDIAHVMRGTVPHAILLAHTPKRLFEAQQLAVPAVISGHTHGGQIVLPAIGAIAAREFPVIAGVEQPRGHDDLREPRRGHGLRADPHQLPARSGGADAGAVHAQLT